MDPFGYAVANIAPRPEGELPRTFAEVRRNGYSPHRDELAELIRRLRARYGRRRVFRRGDVEEVIRDMRWPEQLPSPLRQEGARDLFGARDGGSAGPTRPRVSPATRARRVAARVDRFEGPGLRTIDLTCDEVME